MYKYITIEIFKNFKKRAPSIIKSLSFPFLIIILSGFIIGFIIGLFSHDNNSFELGLFKGNIVLMLYVIYTIIIGIVMAVMIYQEAARGDNEHRVTFIKCLKSGNVLSFALNVIVLFFSMAIIFLFASIAVSLILSLLHERSIISTSFAFMTLAATMIMFYIRAIIILPSSALGDDISLSKAIKLTKGYNLLSFYTVLILPFIFSMLIGILSLILVTLVLMFIGNGAENSMIVSIGYFVVFLLNVLTGVAVSIFTFVCILNLYKYIVNMNCNNERCDEVSNKLSK